MVALMQTMWHTTGKDHWYRATRFFGTAFLINFAMGVVTGIVQEFQFGMNWSDYSRFVGDVFGAPLAFEGLAAFFFESILLGSWIFDWGRLPKALHLASIWIVATAVNVSAYFIIVASSFMQHPVGARFNPDTGRAELVDFWALLTNPTALAVFPHAVFGSWITAGTVVAAVSIFKKVTSTSTARRIIEEDSKLWRACSRMVSYVILLGTAGVAATGHLLAQLMFQQQPMKMASAEALCQTTLDPHFSILSIATFNGCESARHLIGVPFVLSFLAANQFTGVTPACARPRRGATGGGRADAGSAHPRAPLAVAAALTTLIAGLTVLGFVVLGAAHYPAVGDPTWLGMAVLLALAAFESHHALPSADSQAPLSSEAAQRLLACTGHTSPAGLSPSQTVSPPRTDMAEASVRVVGTATGPAVAVHNGVFRPGGSTWSFSVGCGQTAVVSAPSGFGKTSLVEAIAGIVSPHSGTIDIVGMEGRAPAEVLRLYEEDEWIFSTTVRENLLLAQPAADDATLTEACRAVGFPLPLDMVLADGADSLSSGQRQRLILARARLDTTLIVLFDEPTEHIAEADAADLLATLATPEAGRARIVVTHASTDVNHLVFTTNNP